MEVVDTLGHREESFERESVGVIDVDDHVLLHDLVARRRPRSVKGREL